jgi:hypothetical protein
MKSVAAPTLAPTTAKTSTLQSILDKIASELKKPAGFDAVAASACPVKQKGPPTMVVNGRRQERETGIEPATTSLGS